MTSSFERGSGGATYSKSFPPPINKMQFDLLVLGGGPGGVAAAIRGIQLGAKVGLIEDNQWGGTCLNQACVPTKLLSATVDRLNSLKIAGTMGFKNTGAEVDEPTLWNLKNELVGYFSMGTKGLAGSHGVELIEGRGELAGPGRIKVSDEVYEAEKIIVATGNDWVRPDFPGSDLAGVLTSTEFMNQAKVPGSTLLLGGGPWALEMAQFIVTAGGQATVVEESADILPGEDDEICQRLRTMLNVEPLSILTKAKIAKAVQAGEQLKVGILAKGQPQELTVDRIVYFDRAPKLDGLGLETVGLADLSVNEFLATSADNIWALGDVVGDGPALSHRASFMGVLAVENALGEPKKFNPNVVPRVAYTTPQMAAVGLTEEQAEDLDYDVLTGEVPLGVSPMAMILGQSNGLIKVVGEAKYGELLGVHIVAPAATELIGVASLAIQMESTLEELANSCMPHPTIAESLTDAAREALGRAIYLPK